MSLLHRQQQGQQNPLGTPRSSHGYEEGYAFRNGKGSNNYINESGGDRSHPVDVTHMDDSKTPQIPPYLRVLPNNGTNGSNESDLLFKDGSSTAAASSNGKNSNNDETAPTTEEADAAAGVSTAKSVLKRVTSLGAMVSSTSLSALAGMTTSDETITSTTNPSLSSPTATHKNSAKNSNKNKTDNAFASSPSPSSNKKSTTMLNQYYQTSNEFNILNNPNHRNYHHHMYLRNMNMNTGITHPKGSLSLLGSAGVDRIPQSIQQTIIKPSWRLRDRMKTVGVGLIMSLNVGTDPPDMVKPHPSAKLQCWMDPSSVTRAKAKEKIGERLEKQYARWQQQRNTSSSSRSFKNRKALDPTVEDVRALCLWLRKQARHERILLHYNGHGVPKPTPNGEIWVFDKNHTEYIPLSVSDLRQWAGKPTIVILDCSSAGVLVPFLTAPPAETPTNTPPRVSSPILAGSATAALENLQQANMTGRNIRQDNTDDDPIITTMDEAASHWVKDTIVLCPTSEDEWLPMNPEYPADIFTSCLTTPIQMALRWFVRNNRISMGVLFGSGENGHDANYIGDDGPDISVDSIPGQANDRKTPLGELNWIFTSVTDSIAWNVLPKPLFQRLFRQDLLVASMFRNFLLADRILRSLNCTPQSYPPLPPGIADHPLWQAWDLACETCLFGLIKDGIIGRKNTVGGNVNTPIRPSAALNEQQQQHQQDIKMTSPTKQQFPNKNQNDGTSRTASKPTSISLASSISSPFFSEQLTGFEVWLEYASINRGNSDHLEPPEQLPVVLQVLLSQAHRVRALELLRRFLELGPWAVNLALSLGIFPYVMKLLQSAEYKTVLVNIWASILKFDTSCQVDLSKDKSLVHFIQPLAQWSKRTSDGDCTNHTPEAAKQRTLIAFCLASVCHKYPNAQNECLRQNLHRNCAGLLSAQMKVREQQKQQREEEHEQQNSNRRASQDATQYDLLPPIAREWVCMCIGSLVQGFHGAQNQVYNTGVHECLITLQQNDDDPNVRAAATYALGNLFEHVSLPSSNNNSSSQSSMTSSLSRGRLQPTPQPPASTSMPPLVGITPISLGPTAAIPPSFSGGMLSSQGQLQPQPHHQMFLPNPMPAVGLQVARGLPQLQPNPSIPVVNQGPASAALSAAMARGDLAPVGQQLHSIPNPGGQEALAGAMAPTPQQPMEASPMTQPSQGGQQRLSSITAPMVSPQQQQQQQPGMPRIVSALSPQHPTAGVPMVGIGVNPGPVKPQLLTRAVSGPQLGGAAQQQGSLFHPQQRRSSAIASIGGYLGPTAGQPIGIMAASPVGMPIMGSPLGIGASAVGSPIMSMKQMRATPQQQQQQQQRRRPTVYEDRRRIEFDLKVMESMIKVLTDGSAIVRYEVIMGFSNFVEKYLQAILVIAEDATRVMDTLRLGNISEDQDEEGNEITSYSRESSRKRVVTLPQGVNQMIMERFEKCWKALRLIQHDDPHPNVSAAANSIVCVVHETLYDMRMELDARTKNRNKIEGGLTGIQEEGEIGSDGMDRVKSDINLFLASPDQRGNISIGAPQSNSPLKRLPNITPKMYPLRRSSSEAPGGNFPSMSIGDSKSLSSLDNLMDRVKAENLLPKSEFYKWKKSIFRPDYDDEDLEDREDRDPLNPLGAARNYQRRRNAIVRVDGNKIAHHFVELKPRREVQRKSLDMLLDDDDDDEKDDRDAVLQSELKLQEKQLLTNSGGVKMISMLKFHSYENALAVFDNKDYISIWDYENGAEKSSFKNGNPTGSRMTSAFWINESSTSLLFVGSDDGSARIWNGIVQNNGQISSQAPTLSSSFFAIPNMKAGQRGKSGLICEWQQTTGTLISGGNSRYLRCWDMTAEKCSNIIEIETGDSCVTALTTAWDEDNATTIQSNGFRGTGPEIIVAGLSDGTLKIFDIRTPKSGAAMAVATMSNSSSNGKGRGRAMGGNRRRLASLNNKTFTEHGSWIVDVSFTSYGNQNEIMSGCVAGDIRAWDIRMSSRSLRTIEVQRSPMTALSVHRKIPIAATGSHAQFIKILTLDGETLQSAKFHEESLSGIKYDRIGPVSCLEFHRQKLVLAAGSTNALVSVYQPRRRSRV